MYPFHLEQFYFSNLTNFSKLRSIFETKLSNLRSTPLLIKKTAKTRHIFMAWILLYDEEEVVNDEL